MEIRVYKETSDCGSAYVMTWDGLFCGGIEIDAENEDRAIQEVRDRLHDNDDRRLVVTYCGERVCQ